MTVHSENGALMAKLLLVDDDIVLMTMVVESLKRERYLVDVAGSAEEALVLIKLTTYDLFVLDWKLPDMDGISLCHELRCKAAKHTPILFLTGESSISAKEIGFDVGADDYLTKPFQMSELRARIKALLRRPAIIQPREITVDDVVLNMDRREVKRNGQIIDLFAQEYVLFEFFMLHPNQIFTAQELINRVWPTDSESAQETVRVTLMRLRQKLGKPEHKPLIVTLRNAGYRLES